MVVKGERETPDDVVLSLLGPTEDSTYSTGYVCIAMASTCLDLFINTAKTCRADNWHLQCI